MFKRLRYQHTGSDNMAASWPEKWVLPNFWGTSHPAFPCKKITFDYSAYKGATGVNSLQMLAKLFEVLIQ